MATYNITTTQNIDELTGKTGGDIFNINGGVLNIDQHSRFGLNNANTSATAATSMGNITISATLGGTLNIDGRYVRLIPYNGGSGTLPALNSLVTQGGASGRLMCVYSSLTAAPVTTGTIPATGWIMIKQWNQVAYAAGALTLSGITANATGADFTGFLEIMGDESATATLNRLGAMNIYGAWYELGTTNGAAGQTFQVPNHGTLRHIAGVFIEKTAGLGDYEFYRNGGTNVTTGTTVATGTEADRGKMVWINNTGLVTIGNSGGTGLNGYVPPSGRKVVVPNIFLCNCGTAARNAVIIPNATVGTRYDFTTTGAGVFYADKVNFEWYPSFTQAYSVQINNSGIIDAVLLSEISSPISWTNTGVGNKPTTALVTAPLTITFCLEGGTFTDCVFQRVGTTATNATGCQFQDSADFTFTRCVFSYSALRAHTTPSNIVVTRCQNFYFEECTFIDGSVVFNTSILCTLKNLKYINGIVGTTGTANPISAISFGVLCKDITIEGFQLPVTNNHPYNSIILVNAASCTNFDIKLIGTRTAPLNLGTANACAHFIVGNSNAAPYKFKIRRVYVSNTRTGFYSFDNSAKDILFENIGGDYADATDSMGMIDTKLKGKIGNISLSAVTAVYGLTWWDLFTSTTVGRIGVMMNEVTVNNASEIELANGAAFTGAGGLYMPTVGQTAIFTMSYFALGHASFQNSALVMAGGTVGNYRFRYQIDKGSGFGAWSSPDLTAAQLGTALSQETGISTSVGVRLKLEIKTTTTNATAITSVYVLTNTTAADQDILYPLNLTQLTLTGLQTGTEVRAYQGTDPATAVEIGSVESSGTSFSFTHAAAGQAGYIVIHALGYQSIRLDITYPSTDSTIPIQQQIDRQYENPANPPPVSFSQIQKKTYGSSADSTSHNIVLDNAPTQGNTLILCVNSGTSAITVSGWTLVTEAVGWVKGAIYRKTAGAGESATVSVGLGTSLQLAAVVMEYEGLTGNVDQSGAQAGQGSGTANTTPTINTTVANQLLVAVAAVRAQGRPITGWNNSFTEDSEIAVTSSGDDLIGISVGLREVSSTGAYSSTASLTAAGEGQNVALIAGFIKA